MHGFGTFYPICSFMTNTVPLFVVAMIDNIIYNQKFFRRKFDLLTKI